MIEIAIPLTVAAVTAISGLLVKKCYSAGKRHKQHHEQMDGFPDMLKQHKDEHSQIKESIGLVQRANVSQIRAQLVNIHERAMKEGHISTHWKATFYELYEDYKALGGNGFIEAIKAEIDEL